jgi:hypothetical protein
MALNSASRFSTACEFVCRIGLTLAVIFRSFIAFWLRLPARYLTLANCEIGLAACNKNVAT